MTDRFAIIENLRKAARNGSNFCSLLEDIQSAVEPSEFNSFNVMSCLMEAFELSLSQVRELPGAIRLGGGVYSDEEIEAILFPLIKSAINLHNVD